MNKIKVAQFGLGEIGLELLRCAAEQPWLEIVGAVDHDPKKCGRSLVELTGLPQLDGLGLCPTLEELFHETQPDVILHAVSSSAAATFRQVRPALELGLTVVSTCEELIYPALQSPELARELNTLCLHTKARLVAAGMNPGFVMDLLPICLTGLCRSVDSVRVERVFDAASFRQSMPWKIGCGRDPAEFRALLAAPRAGQAGLRESAALIAHTLGWQLTGITEHREPMLATTAIRTEYSAIAAGQVCGIRQRAIGTLDGTEKIVLDLVLQLAAPAPRTVITVCGRPSLKASFESDATGNDATIAAMINVVPRVLAASPGLRLLSELMLPHQIGNRA